MNVFEPSPGSDRRADFQLIRGSSTRRRTRDRGIVHARSHDSLYTWSYTNMLGRRFRHPEILLAGLDPFFASSVLSQVTSLVAAGRTFAARSTCDNLLGKMTCAFRTASRAAMLVLMAADLDRSSQVLQLVYPDNKNILPWEDDYNQTWAGIQPLFLPGTPFGPHECAFLQAARSRSQLKERRAVRPVPTIVKSIQQR